MGYQDEISKRLNNYNSSKPIPVVQGQAFQGGQPVNEAARTSTAGSYSQPKADPKPKELTQIDRLARESQGEILKRLRGQESNSLTQARKIGGEALARQARSMRGQSTQQALQAGLEGQGGAFRAGQAAEMGILQQIGDFSGKIAQAKSDEQMNAVDAASRAIQADVGLREGNQRILRMEMETAAEIGPTALAGVVEDAYGADVVEADAEWREEREESAYVNDSLFQGNENPLGIMPDGSVNESAAVVKKVPGGGFEYMKDGRWVPATGDVLTTIGPLVGQAIEDNAYGDQYRIHEANTLYAESVTSTTAGVDWNFNDAQINTLRNRDASDLADSGIVANVSGTQIAPDPNASIGNIFEINGALWKVTTVDKGSEYARYVVVGIQDSNKDQKSEATYWSPNAYAMRGQIGRD